MAFQLLRPRHVAIFRVDPTGVAGVRAKISAFLLTEAVVGYVPGRVRPDLLRSCRVSGRNEISRSPVERLTSDNVIVMPDVISVSGMFSATPLSPFGGIPFGSLARFDLMQLADLRRMKNSGEPLALVIPARPYASVAISSLEEDHSKSGKVEVSIVFEQIEIVSPLSIPIDPDVLASSSYIETSAGAQSTESVPDLGGLS